MSETRVLTHTSYGFQLDKERVVFISQSEDFPDAVNGVITLVDDYTYFLINDIDLNGSRLVSGQNTTLIGGSSENCSITSTGLGSGIAILTSVYTTPIRHITIKDVDTALDFDGTGNTMALDWTGVNIENVPNIGTIKEFSNFIFSKGAFLNSQGLIFDGNFDTVALNNSLFQGDGSAGNIIEIPSTAVISRRFRIIYSAVIAFGSTTALNINSSATIPVEGYILDTVNFSGGGTYTSGVLYNDNKALFVNCRGIQNSSEVAQYYMNGNATTTVIGAAGTPTKVLGTTTNSSITEKFTHTDNRATYAGAITRIFKVSTTLSCESGNNNQVGCYIAKNGLVISESEVYITTNGAGRFEGATIQTLLQMATGDYIEIFVENNTSANNILVTDLNTIVQ